ncbi:MAG: EthD family reductase [Segniliparus sp.]|uniref:EthD family reductase n=1 Tax=Segniliparus sp. TaxID=2804064 RepID=UPI003F2BDFDB
MHRVTVIYPSTPDPEKFREYYERAHVPLAAKLPGLLGSNYSLDVQTLEGDETFAAVWHGDFASPEAMVAALTSPEGGAVTGDLVNFAPPGVRIIHYALGGSAV